MRFKIISSISDKNRFLPVNYQYHISSWIYRRIGEADQQLAEFLHSQGYGEGNRRFKFFNFGHINLKPYRPHWDRGVFELLGQEVGITVSFFLPEIAESFVRGLFMNNEVFIGDRINGVRLRVKEMQVLPLPEFKETMSYRLISSCCVTRPPQEGETYGQYLGPEDKEFIPRLVDNLKTKFEAARNVPSYAGDFSDNTNIDIQILSKEPKSKLVKVKELTKAATDIRGWVFDCKITAPVEVHEFIWSVGLGEKGSMGFGMVELKKL
ncbi:CRISPR repeat RNA endoribonuclease Cas6 [Fulvivirga imtechensis AK7]|uniref:CRISPR-associated endoribonuclease n=1 Tax=Fulvivirga imtechensis AK7 TaxID=1237149 RepID=L8JVA7_9BACT|nr:CRISPR-associated endoribonuclease Cas6 [Fulvivirga imtechensis]ELR72971.1 CRISPR repeat RNA endoribonuclease Cas6 [Fulvivirga imtechensis AK7]